MKTLFYHRKLGLALGLVLMGAASAALAAPAAAQGGRFRVLVPALEGNKSGAKVAEQVRKAIDQMNTHVSIPEKEVKAAVKKLGAKEDQMSCLQYRQLMTHVDAKLTMCGTIDANGQVVAQFFSPDGSSYDVPAFALTKEDQAAQQIVQGFGAYVNMLAVLTYCDEYLNSSNWPSALEQCTKAAELNPKSTHAIYGQGSALRSLERHEEALAAFQKVLELDAINKDAMLSAALEASALEQQELSNKYLNEYLELNPGDADVRLSIASDVAKKGDLRAALTILEHQGADTTNLTLREYAGHFAVGAAGKIVNAAQAAEIPANAQELFQRALNHYTFVTNARPDSVSGIILRNLMVAHGALGHTEEALSWGQKATSHPEADAQTWSAYADQLRNAEKPQEALAALDKVTQLDPTYAVLARKAVILTDLNRLNEAVATVKEARVKNELPEAQQDNIAQRLIKTGYEDFQKAKKYDQANVYYNAAREIATSEQTRAMANYLQGYGIYEQARAIQEKSTAASAREALPMFERAKTLLQNSTAYAAGAASRANLLSAIDQLIEIQNALIKRGQ